MDSSQPFRHLLAYDTGRFVPEEELLILPYDAGFIWGITVAEQLRTFRGELFAWDEHFTRLVQGLTLLELDGSLDPKSLRQAAFDVVKNNFPLIPQGSDLGVTIFVTPGIHATYGQVQSTVPMGPRIGIHTYPLPFHLWREKYHQGQICRLVSVPQVDPRCWPRSLKCRSRAHYYLADLEARRWHPHARAILLDHHGFLNEASTANIVCYFPNEGWVSPNESEILPGVTLQITAQLARELEIPFSYRPIRPDELSRAEEVILTSTPFCILPAASINEHMFTSRRQWGRLIDQWKVKVGFDFVLQAESSGLCR